MRKFGKKITAALIAGIMAIMMCVPAFAAETQTANEQAVVSSVFSLESPRFVDENGNELLMGMGTDVIDPSSTSINGQIITIPLAQAVIMGVTGFIEEAYYYDMSNATKSDGNLVQNNVLYLNTSKAERMPNGKVGIPVMLKLNLDAMPDQMQPEMAAYFTCEDIQNVVIP